MKNILKFEYTDESGYKTYVEKEWEGLSDIQSVLLEVRYCLIACGFSEQLINEYIPNDI